MALALFVVVGALLLMRRGGIAFEKGARFHTIQYGQSEKTVFDLMGPPDDTRTASPLECNRQPVKAGGPSVAPCAKEFTYYGGLLPEKWVIGVDAQSKVVFKYRYVSF